VPIYTGGGVYARVRQAKETLGQARLQADLQRDMIRASVVSSWGQLDSARAVIQSSKAAASRPRSRSTASGKLPRPLDPRDQLQASGVGVAGIDRGLERHSPATVVVRVDHDVSERLAKLDRGDSMTHFVMRYLFDNFFVMRIAPPVT
jgi:Outer membrane efflux protein